MVLPDRADSVMTPASTGAQQLLATPENTPRANMLAVSPRVASGRAGSGAGSTSGRTG